MNNSKWIEVIKQVGFPIVVALILLVQITPAISRLTAAVERQNVLLERLEKATLDNQRVSAISQDLLQNITQLLVSILSGPREPRGR